MRVATLTARPNGPPSLGYGLFSLILFPGTCTGLHFYQQCLSVLISPRPVPQDVLTSFGILPVQAMKTFSLPSFNLHFNQI